MDRSLLSQKNVIEASRGLVCIRLATYENAAEVKYLEKVFRGGSGQLENTVFAMLSPGADKYLARPGRSPDWAFSGADNMARGLKEIASRYKPTGSPEALPAMENLRLALNVAACDGMPLLVAASNNPETRKKANAFLALLAWTTSLLGKYAYAPASTPAELRAAKLPESEGILLIAPDSYGLTGKVIQRWPLSGTLSVATLEKLRPTLIFSGKVARQHIQNGVRNGFSWQSLLPVTDPH